MSSPKISPTVAARLEARDRAVYQAIVDYRRSHDYGPSYRDICDATHLTSTSIALAAVDALIARGLVEKDLGVNRSLRAIGPYPCAPKCPPHRPRDVGPWGPEAIRNLHDRQETCRDCGRRIRQEWVEVDGA